MTTKAKTPIYIELDGKQHEVRFSWKALCLLEREARLQFSDLALQMKQKVFGFVRITQIIWASLSHEEKPLTIDKLEEILDTTKMEEYGNLIGEAFEDAFPEKEEDSESKNETGSKTKKNGHGKDSSVQATS